MGEPAPVADRASQEAWKVPAACAALALVFGLAAAGTVMSVKDYRVSALVRMGERDPLAELARESEPGFAFFRGDHYDGIYFYGAARDPFARGEEHLLMDLPGARYGHILYAWAAALLSFGDPGSIPLALFLINLVSMGVGGYAASVLARDLGWSPWGGLFFSLNPGFLFAITVDTSEILGCALMVLGLLAWVRRRPALAGAAFVALCLAKEIFIFVPLGILLWEAIRARREGSWSGLVQAAPVLMAGPAALFAWEVYLRFTFGYWAFSDYGNTGLPFLGIGDTLALAAYHGEVGSGFFVQVAAGSIPTLLTVTGAGLVAFGAALKSRTPLAFIFMGFCLINFSLTWHNLYFLKDLLRQFAPTFLLLPAVLADATAFTSRPRWEIPFRKPTTEPVT